MIKKLKLWHYRRKLEQVNGKLELVSLTYCVQELVSFSVFDDSDQQRQQLMNRRMWLRAEALRLGAVIDELEAA